MELISVTDWSKKSKNKRWPTRLPDAECTLSCKNMIAFSSKGCSLDRDHSSDSFIDKIHIVEPDRPWDVHSINTDHQDTITGLMWDQSGTRLLSSDRRGKCVIWKTKDYLMNELYAAYTTVTDQEEILCVSWLHNGIRMSYNVDKLDSTNFKDKFSRVNFEPSASHFGGKPLTGWVGVTATGMVFVSIIKSDGSVQTVCDSLGSQPCRLSVADITFTKDGHIVVACADGSFRCPVICYSLKVIVQTDEKFTFTSESYACFYLQATSESNLRDKYSYITHVNFVSDQSAEHLLVCSGGVHGSCIEAWELLRKPIELHKLFQPLLINSHTPPTCLRWCFKATYLDKSVVSALAVPKLPINLPHKSFNVPGMAIAVAYVDGTIKLLHRLSLQPLSLYKAEGGHRRETEEPANKKVKMCQASFMTSLQLSHTSCSLIAVDNHYRLHLLKVPPNLGQNLDATGLMVSSIAKVVNLLEYCLMSGYDWWDLLLIVAPNSGMVHTVIERLSDEFSRQIPSLQQYIMSKFMSVKTALYRLSPSTRHRAVDCHSLLVLNAIATAIRSVIRPAQMSISDKSPADKLANLCLKNVDSDINQIMLNINSAMKEFTMESYSLQELHKLNQWIANFTLYLLSLIPLMSSYPKHPGVSLLKDNNALSTLRELLIIIKIWGFINPSCLPVFSTCSPKTDTLAVIFKLLTQVWLCNREEGSQTEPDQSLVDLLTTQVVIPKLGHLPNIECITSSAHSKLGQYFQFEPMCGDQSIFEDDSEDSLHYHEDIVRRIHLGSRPSSDLKQCTRCGCVSMLRNVAKMHVMKSWEQRWIRNCLCGGHWKKVNCDNK